VTRGGRRFAKMSGSGNDFVFLDARDTPVPDPLETPEWIRAACARGTGIGADGVVFLGRPRSAEAAAEVRYYNSDGGRASLCGNATLCATRLSAELGLGAGSGFALDTDSGRLAVRMRDDGPEIDLQPVTQVRAAMPDIAPGPSERRVGFAVAGVPHLVVLVDDVEAVDLARRGAALRSHAALGASGANVNFVSADGRGGWRIRTFERGVEGETLACGTGAVASGILLAAWALDDGESRIDLETRSGLRLGVTPRPQADGSWRPSLAGEGRVVFRGELGELGAEPSGGPVVR
jgi:diaminopimelate epimerase